MQRLAGWSAAVVAASLVAGCHHQATDRLSVRDVSSSAASEVPWVDKPAPTITPSPAPSPTAEYDVCTAQQLTATVPSIGAAGGSYYAETKVSDSSDRSCTLTGAPTRVDGVRADGTSITLADHPSGDSMLGPGPVNLQPGDHGYMTLSGADFCDAEQQGQHDYVTSLRITMNDGGVVPADLPERWDIVCGVDATGFGAHVPEPEETSPLDVLHATLDLPDTLPAGQTLDYSVTLTNTSDHGVALAPCPSYAETIVPTQPFHLPESKRYFLNCDAMPSIGAGDSVRFAMRVDLPDQTGVAKFLWQLQATDVAAGAAPEIR